MPLFAVFTGVTSRALVLCAVSYFVRMFFITGAYHRYFAHRTYKTNRAFQLFLAIGGCTAWQQGPLWWAAHHRKHHRYSDTELDPHTPLKGFWWSHVGWFLADKNDPTDFETVSDLAKFPELRFVNRFHWIFPWVLAVFSYTYAGLSGLVIGFFLSTVLLWHGTFTVNSLAHVFGRRRYVTDDTSRNSALIALITMGEGWHNNHHHFPMSVRQGFFWWEVDGSYYVLRILSLTRLVHDLRQPPVSAKSSQRIRDGWFDLGMFRAYIVKAAARLPKAVAPVTKAVAPVADGIHALGDALSSGRASIDAKLQTERDALQTFITSSLQAAETLSKRSRQVRRDATPAP